MTELWDASISDGRFGNKRKRFASIQCHKWVDSIQFDSLQARNQNSYIGCNTIKHSFMHSFVQQSRKHHARNTTLVKSTNGTWVTGLLETYCWLALSVAGCWVTAQGCVCRLCAVCGDLNNGLAAQFQWRKCALEVSCTWDALYKSMPSPFLSFIFYNYKMTMIETKTNRRWIYEPLFPKPNSINGLIDISWNTSCCQCGSLHKNSQYFCIKNVYITFHLLQPVSIRVTFTWTLVSGGR